MFVIPYPHRNNVWLLYECVDSVGENPEAVYCHGYGYVLETKDDTLRISHDLMGKEELEALKKEILEYWRNFEKNKQSVNS